MSQLGVVKGGGKGIKLSVVSQHRTGILAITHCVLINYFVQEIILLLQGRHYFEWIRFFVQKWRFLDGRI